ncbi:MAG: XkdF-like putative serine protease domain-containing protein [Ruminococcus sp.]|nr:XkdF-like putative serine protease domain-containing protein [Ruminococcus sp.]
MKKSLNKAYEITDAKIQFVSLVDKAANKRQFLLKKADDGQATFTTYGRIVKADADNHYVTGIVYEPMAEDSHGNFMTEEEITKAAYWFAKNGDKVDLQHSFDPLEGAAVVENWIAKADFDIDGEAIQKGTWLMTVEVTDESVWEGIEKGDITGFSMGGLGNYSEEDVELDNVSKQQETSERKGLLKQLAKALGLNVVEKGAMAELYEERSKGTLFWNAFNSLEEVLYKYDNITGRWQYETNEDKVRECLEDFNQIISDILTGKESITKAIQTDRPVEKAGKKMSGKNRETLQGIYDNLGTFLAEFDEKTDDPEKIEPEDDDNAKSKKEEKEVTKQEIEEIVAKSVAVAVAKASGNDDEEKDDKTTPGAKDKEDEEKEVKKSEEITSEKIDAMVQAAVEKAFKPQQETVTAEQVQEMIAKAVQQAVEPVLKSKGLPSNLNGNGTVEKAEEHYLHGIL